MAFGYHIFYERRSMKIIELVSKSTFEYRFPRQLKVLPLSYDFRQEILTAVGHSQQLGPNMERGDLESYNDNVM